MAEDNGKKLETNEAEMVDEGAPVQPQTDPEAKEAKKAEKADESGESDEESDRHMGEPDLPDDVEKAVMAEASSLETGAAPEAMMFRAEGDAAAGDADGAGAGAPAAFDRAEADDHAAAATSGDDGDTAAPHELSSELLGEQGATSLEPGAPEGEASPEGALEGAPEEEASDSEYRRRLREYTRELKKLPGDWYIIQSYSGYENKVKTNLDMRIQTLEVEDSIFDVVVPIEQAIELKDGKRKVVKRKLLPGYVLVRMDMNDAAWSVVRETPGVTSFVGNEGNATPVKHRDVARFLMPKETPVEGQPSQANAEGETVVAMPEENTTPALAHDYQVGEAVTILSGALASVSATISEIDPVTGKIQALVSIFGRETPVELTADQIERII